MEDALSTHRHLSRINCPVVLAHGTYETPEFQRQTRDFAAVQVVIPDRPGELARLFRVAEEAGINIEDVSIENSPGLPVGVAELWVRPEIVAGLSGVLAAGGWPVRR